MDSFASPVRMRLSRKAGFNLQVESRALNGLPAVVVTRASKLYGNPFTIADSGSAEAAVDLFEHDLDKGACFHPDQYAIWCAALKGKNLACACRLCPTHAAGKRFTVDCPDCAPCHADVWGRHAAEFRCDAIPEPSHAR